MFPLLCSGIPELKLEIACLHLSRVRFLQTKICINMLYIKTEIGLHSRQLKENSESELKRW